jgi:hypothetical protein
MKKLFTLSLLTLSLFLHSDCKSKPNPTSESILVITSKSGQVSFLRGDMELPGEIGSLLIPGDKISTESSSFVDLELPGGALLRIKPESEVSITSLLSAEGLQVEFQLNRGKIHSKIKNKLKPKESFRIKTPTMVAGVRGTDFSVSGEESGKVMVLEGSVGIESTTSSEEVYVDSGKKGQGDSLEILDLTEEEKKELLNDSSSLSGKWEELKNQIQENLQELKEKQGHLLQIQKEGNQNTLNEQKARNQEGLEDQKTRDRNSLNTQKETDKGNLESQKTKGSKEVQSQLESGKAGVQEIQNNSKDASKEIQQGANSQKKQINDLKNSMDTLKNTNPLESVKPK